MSHLIVKGTALFVAALALAVPTASDAASDRKVDNGLNCQPYRTTTSHADLAYRPAGLSNISDTDEYVVCGITVDVDELDTWTEANPGQVGIVMYNPTETVPTCRVFMGSNVAGTSTTLTENLIPFSANLWYTNIYADTTGVVQTGMVYVPATLYCKLPPGATIVRITLHENALTHVP